MARIKDLASDTTLSSTDRFAIDSAADGTRSISKDNAFAELMPVVGKTAVNPTPTVTDITFSYPGSLNQAPTMFSLYATTQTGATINTTPLYVQHIVEATAPLNGAPGAATFGLLVKRSGLDNYGVFAIGNADAAVTNPSIGILWAATRGIMTAGANEIDGVRASGEQSNGTSPQNPRAAFLVLNSTQYNAWNHGLWVESAVTYGVRVGRNDVAPANVIVPTYPFAFEKGIAGARPFYVDSNGVVSATQVNIGSTQTLQINSDFTTMYDASGANPALQLGNSIPTNYYNNTTHIWRARAAGATFATLVAGSWTLNGTTGGAVSIKTQAVAGTYNFNLPTSAGNAGEALISGGGGGASPMTWTSGAVATQAYAQALFASNDALLYKGVIDCSANPNYPAADAGHLYKVSVAGKIGGASGLNVEVGDSILCTVDGSAAGNQATVGANWNVVQVNLDGAVIGPTSAVSGRIATFSGTTGKLIQDSGKSFPISLTADVTGTLPVANGGTSVTSLPLPPQGRLTLTSGTPVLAASVSGATTIYYTPYCGALVPFYDGTNFVLKVCAELSNVTTASSVGSAGPAAVAANSVYDLYVWDNGGTPTLTRSPAWTNDTTRSAGAAQTRVNGIILNSVAITNGPAASRGTWVGTVGSNGSSTIDFIFGGLAAGGTAAVFNVWNAYNRVSVSALVMDSTDQWNRAAGRGPANASTAMRCTFLYGAQEDEGYAQYMAPATAGGGAWASLGIGYNSTTALIGAAANTFQSAVVQTMMGFYSVQPFGRNFFQAMENANGATAIFYGDQGASPDIQNGLYCRLRM